MQSTTTITGFDSSTVQSPTGDVTVSNSPTNFSTFNDFFGNPTSGSSGTLNAFGVVTSTSSAGIGATPTGTASPDSTDALDRTLTSTAIGGATENLSNYSWEGPQTVTAPDGTVSTYTYTSWGGVATESTATLQVTFAYDADGNVVQTTDTGTPASGPTLTTSTSEDWDTLGRPTKYVDEMGRTTNYNYRGGS